MLIAVLTTVPTPVICIRGEQIISVNRSFVNAFGYDGDDLRRVSDWWALAYRDQSDRSRMRERWAAELRKLDQHGRLYKPLEEPITCKDGSRRFLEVHLSRVAGNSGVEALYVLSMLDVTARRQTQQALENAKRQAEEANLAKTSFLANMSHELRTPLNAIIGFSEILEKENFGPLGNERYKIFVEDILNSARHLNSLVNDVLDFSKAEAGGIVLSLEDTDLPSLVKTCVRIVSPRAAAQSIDLLVNIPAEITIVSDPVALRRILLNILFNAVKFTSPGGTVFVRAGEVRDTRGIRIGTQISIADTGIGMTEEDKEVALVPFRQVDPSLARRHEGTGLGLPLAKKLIELLNGTLTIESEPGIGTIVSFYIPIPA